MKLFEQIERKMQHLIANVKPWRQVRKSCKKIKQKKHRVERRRAMIEPDCQAMYRKYSGWEY